jgi:hypothetical protein
MALYIDELEEKIVTRLLAQYSEYVLALKEQDSLRQRILATSSSQNPSIAEADHIRTTLENIELYSQRLSQEMSFAWPRIWMLYKLLAYANTPKAIVTLGDLRTHCLPEGYICTKRWAFLKRMSSNYTYCEVHDTNVFPDTMMLEDFLSIDHVHTFIHDPYLIKEWQRHEYFIQDDRIAKWMI